MQLSRSITILLFFLLLSAVFVSCVEKVPLSDDQRAFAGKWMADDGTYVVIYNDGGGDFKGSNTSIKGGKAIFEKDSITIGFGPIKKTLKITERPKQLKGNWIMVLDGFPYRKQQ